MENIIYNMNILLDSIPQYNAMLFDRKYINIALLFWGCIFCIIAATGMAISRNFNRRKRKWMICMQIFTALLLFNDLLAWIFRGYPGTVGYWMVRVSNFFVFANSIVILYFFHKYVCSYLFTREEENKLKRAIFINVLCFIAIVLIIISQFTNFYYHFDADNLYHRNQAYIISMILPVIGMMVELSLLIQYQKRISKIAFIALSSYIMLPILAAAIQIVYYGFSLINISICISMMIMYVTVMSEQNVKLSILSKKQIETVAELEISMVLNQCIAELTTEADINIAIHNLLAIINNYFCADRCYIFEIDYEKNIIINTYEYVNDGVTAQKNNLQEVPLDAVAQWIKIFKEEKPYYISDINQEKGTEAYNILREQNISKLIAVPLKRDGDIIGFLGVDNPASHYDDATLLSSIQYFVTNSLEKKVQQEKLHYLSYKDMLTRIYNRNKYISVVESAKGQVLRNVGVAYIDLNGLKTMNDNYGHSKGDELICTAATVLTDIFPDNCYRVGGDEFVIVMKNIEQSTYNEKIRKVKEDMKLNNVSISIGVLYRESVNDLEELLKSADKLMYMEKEEYHKKKA